MFGILNTSDTHYLLYPVYPVLYKSFDSEDANLSEFQLMPVTQAYEELAEGKDIYFFNSENKPVRVKSITKQPYQGKICDVDAVNDVVLARRNSLLQRMGLVEKVGSGIARMRKAMQEYGIKGPNFDISENWFTISFRRPKKTTQKILGLIKNNPYITRKDLAKSIGNITEDGIKYHLSVLIKKGMLKRVGQDKGGYWKIEKSGRTTEFKQNE